MVATGARSSGQAGDDGAHKRRPGVVPGRVVRDRALQVWARGVDMGVSVMVSVSMNVSTSMSFEL
eukprot:364969-Chlamydomonas_euryale.AAC.4